MLTQKRLRELLDYDPATGVFSRLVDRAGNARKGDVAGTLSLGRRRIRVDNRLYLASNLAVLYMTGRWARNDVDHRNRIKTDDRWSNLRMATRSQNNANRVNRSKGFYWDAVNKKYAAQIKVNGKHIFLGRYRTRRQASAAYADANLEHFGEFARV